MPGTPSIPLPVTVRRAWFGITESALTGYRASVRRLEISVPGLSGSAKGRTNTGMPRREIGMSARGWSTFAP